MGSKAVTASKTTLAIDLIHKKQIHSLPIVSTRPVNIAAVDDLQGKYPRGVASALAPPSGVGVGVLAEILRFPQIPFNGGYSYYLGFCFELHLFGFAALSAYIIMTVALRFQLVARRSGLSWGSNALRRTVPGRSYSSAASVDGSLPLAGIRVLDMTRVLAGVSTSFAVLLYVYDPS